MFFNKNNSIRPIYDEEPHVGTLFLSDSKVILQVQAGLGPDLEEVSCQG